MSESNILSDPIASKGLVWNMIAILSLAERRIVFSPLAMDWHVDRKTLKDIKIKKKKTLKLYCHSDIISIFGTPFCFALL